MGRLRDFFFRVSSGKSIAVTAALLAAVAAVNFSLYFALFLPETGGTAYMELNFGYLPSDLFAYAEAYGDTGRAMYIAMSCTLDLLTPLLASALLIQAVTLLSKKSGARRCPKAGFALGVCCCLSDWAENVCMIIILASYPARPAAAAALAWLFTLLKFLFMLADIAVAAVLCVSLARKRRR